MNADLLHLLNWISINRDAFPEAWREAQPILEAARHQQTREAEIERVNASLRRFRSTWSRLGDTLKPAEAPRRSIPCDFRPKLTELPIRRPVRHNFVKLDGSPIYPLKKPESDSGFSLDAAIHAALQ
jgi:hypothetical protein